MAQGAARRSMITKVLLTGGSGTVGKKVLERLCEQASFAVTAFDADTNQSRKIYRHYAKKIKVVYGDLSKKEDIEPCCKDIDVVIHLAAIIPPLAFEKPGLTHSVNVTGTQNLVDSLSKHSNNAFIIYASSVAVYGDRVNNPMITVSDPLAPPEGDVYAESKIQAEEIIMKSKLDWCIFRLSPILGPDNFSASGLMFRMPLATSMEITSPENAAIAFVKAIEKKALLSHKIFNLGGGKNSRIIYRDFIERSFSIMGLGKADFPEHAFAQKNFHVGFYADGDELNQLLGFRGDTVNSLFEKLQQSISPFRYIVTRLLRRVIKNRLLKQSEPYKAWMQNDKTLIQRYFI